MATCDGCGTAILFGGKKEGPYRFCGPACRDKSGALLRGLGVPDDAVRDRAIQIRESACPECGGEGPIDVHADHWVWSALAFTRWGSRPKLRCRGCARKAQLGNVAKSAVLGWWGFPWGLIFTPVQITRNLHAALSWDSGEPSPRLMNLARAQLASGMKPVAADRDLA